MTPDTASGPGDLAGRRRLRADQARLVADVIRQQILRGTYSALPDERSLGEEFNASRNTIRDALDLLRADGLIERQPGVGTVVVGRKYAHGLDRLMGLAETLHEHGTITNEVRTATVIDAPATVAQRLECVRAVYIERLRMLNDLPLSLDLTYLPVDIGEPLLAEDLRNRDIFGLIEQVHGQPLGVAEIGMEAVNADPHSAMILQVPRGSALLLVERLSHFGCGRPIDLEFIRFRGDRLTIRAHVSRG
ncbi:GntR family transcriptional regulator [Kibdelosporangium philippinense]|uniref:GntR family transcriptional regulator n=2 Tax=Kibdelosporangium philippinense TaxID=211113 RepID=A0ABS8ZEL3_9PSEU|nr:GntR family transcriptional regulator [Kibdelosporangium philippinense]MCE7006261.1 GntR family transcriptional regulator [Kibdelosporangium philippinense]